MTTVLCMIVKNEAHVIERCLESVRDVIDTWLIVDTGSTDGTKKVITKTMGEIDGVLTDQPWVDFATNRNHALDMARRMGDYILVMDADDVLSGANWNDRTQFDLNADGYSFTYRQGATTWTRPTLLKSSAPWHYQGALHEYLTGAEAVLLPGVMVDCLGGGGRSLGKTVEEKYAADAELLAEAVKTDPDPRSWFYLATSYRDSGQTAKAVDAFRMRTTLGGFDEEVYLSHLNLAMLLERLGAAHGDVVAAYLRAYENRPARAESLCELARYLRLRGEYRTAALFAAEAAATPRPDDLLFIDQSVYDWRALDELAVSSYWVEEREYSASICRRLLASDKLPPEQVERVRANLNYAVDLTC